jgi:hypothetical protein
MFEVERTEVMDSVIGGSYLYIFMFCITPMQKDINADIILKIQFLIWNTA